MRNLVLSFVLISLFAISCNSNEDNEEKNNLTEKGKVSLVITEDYSQKATSWGIYSDRFLPNDFFNLYKINKPIYPSEDVNVHFISKEATSQYKAGELVKSFKLHIGTNNLDDLAKIKYDVVVTSITKYDKDEYGYDVENLDWFKHSNAINELPVLSPRIHFFTKKTIDFSTEELAEIKLENPYAMVRVLKYYLAYNELEFDGENFTEIELSNVYARPRSIGSEPSDEIKLQSDNSLYYYIYTRNEAYVSSKVNGSLNIDLGFNNMTSNNVYTIIPFGQYNHISTTGYREFSFNDNILN